MEGMGGMGGGRRRKVDNNKYYELLVSFFFKFFCFYSLPDLCPELQFSDQYK